MNTDHSLICKCSTTVLTSRVESSLAALVSEIVGRNSPCVPHTEPEMVACLSTGLSPYAGALDRPTTRTAGCPTKLKFIVAQGCSKQIESAYGGK